MSQDELVAQNALKRSEKTKHSVPLAHWLSRLLHQNELMLLLILVLMIVAVTLGNPRFLSADNVQSLTRDIALIALLGVGQAFVILLGSIDLSVGSVYGLCGVIAAIFIVTWKLPILPAIVLTLAIGASIGIVHGLFVSKLKMHGFLITLVTLGLARGMAIAITTGYPVTGIPADMRPLAQATLLGLPIPFIILIVIAAAAFVLARFTFIGRQIYAVGGNAEAARLSGVPVDRRIILCFAISACCAALVGIINAARLASGHPAAGTGAELTAAACVIGGVSLYGGQGSILGVVIGAAIMGVLQNAMIILRVSPYWHEVVIALVLLTAITLDMWRRRATKN